MHGNLILAGLDGLAAMDLQHQYRQHIGSRFVLVLPGSSLLDDATVEQEISGSNTFN